MREASEIRPSTVVCLCDNDDDNVYEDTPWWQFFQWCPCSKKIHREMEKAMLASIRTPYKFRNVNIGPVVGDEDCKIWTLSLNETSEATPLVLLHGFGSGLALWSLNLDDLATNRPVHAIDILGFAGSSRPKFSTTFEQVEEEFILSIEAWRNVMEIHKFIPVGHSFGGFLCTLYSIRFPTAVEHLILADPWGFKERPDHPTKALNLPPALIILLKIFVPFNFTPFWALRFFGRITPTFIQFFRQDLIKNFVPEVKDASRILSNYIFQCNARTPTGESAFNCLMSSFGWAKKPLNQRIHELDHEIPLTIIYGTNSWIDHASAEEIHANRCGAFVDTHLVAECGHHVYTENRPVFNKIVLQACVNTKSKLFFDEILIESPCCSNEDLP